MLLPIIYPDKKAENAGYKKGDYVTFKTSKKSGLSKPEYYYDYGTVDSTIRNNVWISYVAPQEGLIKKDYKDIKNFKTDVNKAKEYVKEENSKIDKKKENN